MRTGTRILAPHRRKWATELALAAAAAIALAHPTRAQAQLKLEIAPALGAYAPGGSLADLFVDLFACGYPKSIPTPTTCEIPHLKQDGAVAVGGRVTAWLGKRGAIEGSFWYAPSGLTDTTRYTPSSPQGSGGGENDNVVVISLRAVVNVVAPVRAMSVFLMGGPAVVRRAGAAWAYTSKTTSKGGVLGVGLDIHPGHGLAFRAAIENYLYKLYKLDSGYAPGAMPSTFHHDFVFSLSMGPSLLGQRGERR